MKHITKKFLIKGEKIYLKDIANNYFDFIRKERKLGYRQIIISSDILINLLFSKAQNDGALIKKIEIQRDDNDVQEYLDSLVEKANLKKDYLNLLIFLKPIDFSDSIEIKAVKYSYRREKLIEVEVSNNGIVQMNERNDNESNSLIKFIERSRKNANKIH